MDLARSRQADGDKDVHVVEDIIRTNAFGIYTAEGRDMKGLYPEMARLNHDCDPNAYPQYTKGDLAMAVVATRDIEPSEEISISYIPLGMPTLYRRKSLSNWSFKCTCSLCSSGTDSPPSESDKRRNRLIGLFHHMKKLRPSNHESDVETQQKYDQLAQYTREFVEIVQTERLYPKVGEYYQEFMKMYFAFGDVESANKYARTALRYAAAFADPERGVLRGVQNGFGVVGGVDEGAGGDGDGATGIGD